MTINFPTVEMYPQPLEQISDEELAQQHLERHRRGMLISSAICKLMDMSQKELALTLQLKDEIRSRPHFDTTQLAEATWLSDGDFTESEVSDVFAQISEGMASSDRPAQAEPMYQEDAA